MIKKNSKSKYWNQIVEIIDTRFPKGKCKERGAALVALVEIETLLYNTPTELSVCCNSEKKEYTPTGEYTRIICSYCGELFEVRKDMTELIKKGFGSSLDSSMQCKQPEKPIIASCKNCRSEFIVWTSDSNKCPECEETVVFNKSSAKNNTAWAFWFKGDKRDEAGFCFWSEKNEHGEFYETRKDALIALDKACSQMIAYHDKPERSFFKVVKVTVME